MSARQLSPFEIKLNAWAVQHFTKVSLLDKMLFLDHLRIMVRGGLPLVESLQVLGRETDNKKMQQCITVILSEVENGKQLSAALSLFPNIFAPMYVKMIEAGETGGNLDSALEQAVIQLRKAYELTSSVRGAMIYPAVIVVAMGGIGVMMVMFILPQLLSMFKEFNAELPLPTKILIKISDTLSQPLNVLITLILLAGFIYGFIFLLRHSYPFRRTVHAFLLKFPIIGGIIKKVNLARFSLTLSSLLKSAIPVVDALRITGDTCGNIQYQEALHAAGDNVKTGAQLSTTLEQHTSLFPPMVVEMTMVGEQSGEMEKLLSELATFYNDDVAKTMKNFTTVIEPIIIITIGIAVGGMAVAVIMPMYSLVQQF